MGIIKFIGEVDLESILMRDAKIKMPKAVFFKII